MNKCNECTHVFSSKDHLHRHIREQHSSEKQLCEVCGGSYSNKRKLEYHQKIHHTQAKRMKMTETETIENVEPLHDQPSTSNFSTVDAKGDELIFCETCKVSVSKNSINNHLRTLAHKSNNIRKYSKDENIEIVDSAFKSRIVSYRVSDLNKEHISLNDFMATVKNKINNLIKIQVDISNALKLNFELYVLYTKYNMEENVNVSKVTLFNTKNYIVVRSSDLEEIYSQIVSDLNNQSEDFQTKDSGWTLEKMLFIEVNINKYNPMRGSSYINLPEAIIHKRAVINIQNEDQACFAWAMIASRCDRRKLKIKKPYRCSSYPHYSTEFVFDNISFPMRLKDISKFEALNNVSINVYGLEEDQIVGPLHYTKSRKEEHVNLLFLDDGANTHYCWIKNFSALVGSQFSKRGHKIWICDGCLVFFRTELALKNHLKHGCYKVKCNLPNEKNKILKFTNYPKKERVPFIIYCDFEAILKPLNTCIPDTQFPFTQNIIKHEPYSFAYYIKCSYDDTLSKFELYRGEDCGKKFIEKLRVDLKIIYHKLYSKIQMLELNSEEKLMYENSLICHICEQEFIDSESIKVRNHCHFTGKFRGAAHMSCNLNYKVVDFVPLVCHNLSGYDSHFIIKELGFDNEQIDLIAQNKERYISFTKHFKLNNHQNIQLRFIDSFKFMASSIDNLAKNLEANQFLEIQKHFPNPSQCNLITQKGVFPYDFLDSYKKLNYPCLPPSSNFYNKLTECNITDEQYAHALKVWSEFDCKNLGDYSDLYLKSDVLLLADIFENFRNICINTYDLDPAQYYTSPGLSWDAMMKYTKVEMELLTDIDMVNFINKGVRGGLSQCSKRYAKANNKYMKEYIKKDGDISSYIIYLDANNLYGYAMSQFLPYANFKWLTDIQISEFNLATKSDEGDVGYILEVDLDYPEQLHKLHNDFPFCMENIKPNYITSKQNKLIANLHPKTNYIIHFQSLKQCLSEGLILKKIHRVLQFNQKPFLKSYIDLNTSLRAQAKNSFFKDFYKLLNNSVFGKTLEDVFKRKDIKLLTHWENIAQKFGASNLINRPNFHSSSIFSENLVAIQMNRVQITLNKPIYVGFSVLELSKSLMYDFHYKYIITKYNENVELLYTDTDSLIYEIKTDDFYEDIKPDIDTRFDTSDFPPQNVYGLPLRNKKVLGMFKDECNGKIISEFIGLKAKTYCYLLDDDNEVTKKLKGIKKSVVSKHISFDDYKNCLNHNEKILRSQLNFISIKHNLYTQLCNKLALTNDDDKRFVIPHSYNTLAWGNKNIEKFYYT